LRLLEEENQILKKELKFFENNSYNFVAARIIGKDSTASDTFILNKGSRDGIKVGLPVVIDEGILVGKIVKVEEGISNFLLLTDNNSKVAAAVLQNNMDFSKTNGIVTGEHGLSMKMEFIPKDVNLGEGDIVITSGLEKDIPRGLVIGKIDRVINEEGLVFQSAIVKQMARVDDLSIVSILLP
jgi:rod shape-determining protein MreC